MAEYQWTSPVFLAATTSSGVIVTAGAAAEATRAEIASESDSTPAPARTARPDGPVGLGFRLIGSDLEERRVARLNTFRLLLHLGRILLHRLDLGEGPPPLALLHQRVRRP